MDAAVITTVFAPRLRTSPTASSRSEASFSAGNSMTRDPQLSEAVEIVIRKGIEVPHHDVRHDACLKADRAAAVDSHHQIGLGREAGKQCLGPWNRGRTDEERSHEDASPALREPTGTAASRTGRTNRAATMLRISEGTT